MGSGIGPDSVGGGDGWRRVRSSTGPRETGRGPDSDRVGGGDRVSWQLGARFTGVRK